MLPEIPSSSEVLGRDALYGDWQPAVGRAFDSIECRDCVDATS